MPFEVLVVRVTAPSFFNNGKVRPQAPAPDDVSVVKTPSGVTVKSWVKVGLPAGADEVGLYVSRKRTSSGCVNDAPNLAWYCVGMLASRFQVPDCCSVG